MLVIGIGDKELFAHIIIIIILITAVFFASPSQMAKAGFHF